MNIIAIIVIFSILIIVHEFGHFLAARHSGVRVERFAVGFGPALLKIKRKETEFLICLFPLGGYVKLAGDSRAECRGARDEFLSKAAGIKARIVFAGPLFNYLLAFILMWLMFTFMGFFSSKPIVGIVLEDYPAYSAGIKEGDKVLEVNSRPVETWVDMAGLIQQSKDEIILKIDREGEIFFTEIPLREEEMIDIDGKKKSIFIIGVAPVIEKFNPFMAFVKSGQQIWSLTVLNLKGFASVILGRVPFKKAIAGPLGIFYFTSQAVKIGFAAVLNLMIILNISLTIVNLFPLPILDGGHILIFLIEKLRKKRLSARVEDFLTRAGFVLLAVLIIFVFSVDIPRFGPKLWGAKTAQLEENLEQ